MFLKTVSRGASRTHLRRGDGGVESVMLDDRGLDQPDPLTVAICMCKKMVTCPHFLTCLFVGYTICANNRVFNHVEAG